MDADRLLDPATPESEVDAELRAMGLDPERVALTGQVTFLRAKVDVLEDRLTRQAALIEALLATDRQELPRPLAMLVDAYVRDCAARKRG